MSNVPSSAIIAIVAIVAACIIGAFIFTTVQSQKESGNQAVSKTETMNSSLDESRYTQYDGATVTGTQVLAAIKLLKNDGIAVIVNNGKQSTQYLNTIGVHNVASNTGTLSSTADSSGNQGDAPYADLMKKAKTKSETAYYITSTGNFTGTVIRDSGNQSIIGVVFSLNGAQAHFGSEIS